MCRNAFRINCALIAILPVTHLQTFLIAYPLQRQVVFMKNTFQIRTFWYFASFVTISIILLFMIQSAHSNENSLKSLQANLPKQAGRWSAQTGDRIFDQETIYSYIDGGAEVYKAYNFRQCLSRRYTLTGGPAIVLDIFEMGSSEDAYGVFTHDIDGDKIDIGQNGRLRPGWLSFWKHRFFVSIYMEEETAAAEEAVKKLGRQVADKITGHGPKPQILSQLPPAGLQIERIRYLHHPIVLNYHYYISDENILNISADTEVVLAEYKTGNQVARLLLIKYPMSEKAAQSQVNFLNHYLPDADKSGAALLENGKWALTHRKGNLLAIVLEADSREYAERLLKNVQP
jgi:hypothetical protein